MTMGERIHDRRKACDLTLEYVGNFVGVAKSTVRKWENGDIENISALRLQKLANVLGTTVDYLMDGVTLSPCPTLGFCRSSVRSLAASRFLQSRISRVTLSLIGAFTLILFFAV